MSFSPSGTILAALDGTPSIHLWNVDPADVLLIAPLPAVSATQLQWVTENILAVLEPGANDGAGLWWVRTLDRADRWRPHTNLDELLTTSTKLARLTQAGRGYAVVHPDGTKVKLKRSQQTSLHAVDPLGRFVVLGHGEGLELFDAHSGELLERVELHDAALTGLGLGPGGAWLASASADGRIMRIEPMRDHHGMRLATARDGATCLGVSPSGEYVAVGDESGHVNVFFTADGARVFRTPRRVPGFDAEFVLAEDIGFVGIRKEAYGAFLGNSRTILPMRPLPGTASAACPGRHFPEMVTALDDGRVLQVQLNRETYTELGTAPWPITQLATSEFGIFGVAQEGLWWFDGFEVKVVETPQPDARCVACNRAGERVAIARPDHVQILSPDGSELERLELPHVTSMTFAVHKGREVLVLIDSYRVLWRYQPTLGATSGAKRSPPARVGLIETDIRGTLWRVLSLMADEDGTIRALAQGDNTHRWLVSVDLSSGHANLLVGLVLLGHQVVAAYDEDGTWLRDENDRSIRMVKGLRAFELHDWLRPTEPGE